MSKPKTDAAKRAQKKYDESHKEQVKRIDIKIDREAYAKELAILDSMESRQYFLMWLVTEYANNEELQKKWEKEPKKSGK